MTREQLIEAAREFLQDADYSYRHVSSNRTLPEAIADFAAQQLERAESVIKQIADQGYWSSKYVPRDELVKITDENTDLAREYFAGERDGP